MLHIHFGAGRLGLGLVVPILVRRQKELSAARFALFQRPNHDEWRVVAESEHLDLIVNGELITRFLCITDGFSGELPKLLERNDYPLFVSTSRLDLLSFLVQRATSFSTAVGVAGLAGVQQGLALRCTRSAELPKLYAFENDVSAVQQLAAATTHVVKVMPVSSDRICMERSILKGRLELRCEHFPGAAVLYDPEPLCGLVPVHHQRAATVLNTKTEADREFFAKRKFILVNGMHTVMALWVYGDLHHRGVDRHDWPQADIRQWWRSSSNHRGRQLAVLLSARVLQLLHDVPSGVLQRVIGTTDVCEARRATLNYAHAAVRRILAQRDHVGRILDLSDEKMLRSKLAARFYDLRDFVQSKAHAYCHQRRLKAIQLVIDDIHAIAEVIQAPHQTQTPQAEVACSSAKDATALA